MLVLFLGAGYTASAQICELNSTNQNQDLCTACSTGINPAIVDGVFSGSLIVSTGSTYRISTACLDALTFSGQVDIYISRYTNLEFDKPPTAASGTTVTADYNHHKHSGYIYAYGTYYYPRMSDGTGYADFAARMTQAASTGTRQTGPGVGGGSGGEFQLPVTLIEWEATPTQGGVRLRWVTTEEQDNDYYVIEHSTDGRHFTPLTKLGGALRSAALLNYAYVHERPAAGNHFYRLTQYDMDGTATSYAVRSVTVEGGELSVYPDPAAPGQEVTVRAGAATGTVRLHHADGRLIRTFDFVPGTEHGIRMPGDLPAGLYIVRFGEQQKLLVVR